MQFIDTHVHLIHRDKLGYSWTERIAALAFGDFTTTDYFELAGGAVSDAIYMEMAVDGDTGWQDEARLISEMMHDKTERLSGFVASCRPELPGIEPWIDECLDLGVSGFRRVLHEAPDELSQSETYRANVRRIGAAGLPYDLSFNDRQLGIAKDLALACPDVKLVLNHLGVPRIAEGAFDTWRDGITALAELPNVWCKLSGVTAYCAQGTDAEAAIAPYVDHALNAFGAARMVWGSDWPVVNLGTSLPRWIEISQRILSRLSADEARAIARGNAPNLYRMTGT